MYNSFNGYNPQVPFGYQVPQRYEIFKVNGENGANMFQMAPKSSVLLLDETAPIVWLKTTDDAGYPTLTPYKIEPYQKPKETEPDFKSLEKRIERLEGLLHDLEPNNGSTNAK